MNILEKIDKYLDEKQNWYLHIIYDDDEKNWYVMHSAYYEPQLGGQVMKEFKGKNSGKQAEKFAQKIKKNEIIQLWRKKGQRGVDAKFINYPYTPQE